MYQWFPNKLVCRRFDVPEPYPGMRQEGCPTLDAEKEQRESKSESTIQECVRISNTLGRL